MIYPVTPFSKPAIASIQVPSSKSITNRALLLAAMSKGKVEIVNPLVSRDSQIMAQCLKNLGFKINVSENSISVSGSAKNSAELFVGNAGTAARFITAFVCTIKDGTFDFNSDVEMYKRPMKGLIEALENLGASFEFKKDNYCFPFTVKTNRFAGGKITLDASESSQILSAILMAQTQASSDAEVCLKGDTVSKPFVEMTLKMMRQFGFEVECLADGKYVVKNSNSKKISSYKIETDATAASYPIALAAVTSGVVLVKNFPEDGLQGDVKFAEVIERAGLVKCKRVENDLLVLSCDNSSNEPCEFNFNDISDTFLTLAAIAPLFERVIKITGIAHTRKQESDRIKAMACEISKFAKKVDFDDDSITIYPYAKSELSQNILRPVKIETYKDHRIAMSNGITASKNIFNDGKPWIEIIDPKCTSKTWINFFEILEQARQDSMKFKTVAIDGGAAVGKSSVSKECAKTLNYMHVDTGAHYRTLAYILLNGKTTPEAGEDAVFKALKDIEISTITVGNSARMSVGGKEIEDALIRTDIVNQNVSLFAAMPCVREFLKGYQRSMADVAKEKNFAGLVMEGRDIGSVIFPNATIKIFLDADEETRRKRRASEGISDAISKRDEIDKNRKTAPLVRPEGSVLIDTSHMTKDEVIAKTLALIVEA